MTIPDRLHSYHRLTGLTWDDVAERIGCSRSMLFHVLKGVRRFSVGMEARVEKLYRAVAPKKRVLVGMATTPGIKSEHWSDSNGMPEGGCTYGVGFAISWQHGPLGRGPERKEPNGAFVEDIITAAIDRLEYYQNSPFASNYNRDAVAHLRAAIERLQARTRERESREVEGTREK